MKKALITGSAGLIGSEAVNFFCEKGVEVLGVDNNLRAYFFGREATTSWNRKLLEEKYKNYQHFKVDIRDKEAIETVFKKNKFDLIIHAAAQPSHDWAAKEPLTDFTVNALGTLILLENFRKYCPEAVFIFTSTNKVYGDRPNNLPLVELKTRYDLPKTHRYYKGIDESMSIDDSLHSLFGVSKTAADLAVQEYGQYFGLKTGVFRGGCLTGPAHSGTQLHGFLAYLIRCIATGQKYTIFGYKGKQVRDNIHSYDLVNAFYHFYQKPRSGEVYNMGGSRYSNISMLEAIGKIEKILGRKANYEYKDESRIGDHIWYISDVAKFQKHYPKWHYHYGIDRILEEICLAGYFASENIGSSMLTLFKGNSEKREKMGKTFLASYLSEAYAAPKALRLHLGSLAEETVSVEHSLAEANRNPFNSLKHLLVNFRWFYSHRRKIKVYFGTNGINTLPGVILKKLRFKFRLIYYSIDYSPRRFSNPFLNWFFHWIDKLCVSTADFVWSASPEIQGLRRQQGLAEEKNILVKSGVQWLTKTKKPRKKTKKQRATLVIDGFLSRNLHVKMAIKSLSFLRKKFPELNLKIVVGYLNKKKLESSARKLGVLGAIEFLENIPHQKIFSHYPHYGIGLALFRAIPEEIAAYRDAIEIKEFLAGGLPVICSQGLQIAEEIERKKMGLKIENGTEAISKGVTLLLTDLKKYDQFSRNALRYASSLSWGQVFDSALKRLGLF